MTSPAPTSEGHVYLGHVFHVAGSPTLAEAPAHLVSLPQGALVTASDGTIAWVGRAVDLPADFDSLPVTDTRGGFILPGFVDTHVHFPQTYSTDAYGGGQLLEWLDNCVFPAESRLQDDEFAAAIARDFTRRRTAAGTTSALVFGSAFPHAQDALFAESERAGLRLVSGREIGRASCRERVLWYV